MTEVRLPEGWQLQPHDRGIIVTAPDSSGVLVDPNNGSIAGIVLWELASAILAATPPAAPVAETVALQALNLLVAAGYVTQFKANHAISIAKGLEAPPLAPLAAPDEAMVRDAMRYRWLRENLDFYTNCSPELPTFIDQPHDAEEFDATLDAALAAALTGDKA